MSFVRELAGALYSPHNSRYSPIRLCVIQREANRSAFLLDHHTATVTCTHTQC